jgi:parallel beta-helix repeat protein
MYSMNKFSGLLILKMIYMKCNQVLSAYTFVYQMNSLKFRKTFKSLSFLFVLMLVMPAWTPSLAKEPAETVFYVSPQGSDSNIGTSTNKAFASLQKARDVIRILKSNGGLKSPVTVYLMDGTYELSEPFILKTEDSGTEACPITYTAYNNGEVIISGGKKINSQWVNYKGNIMVCDIPEAQDGKWKFRQLFVNGKRMDRARTPNKGHYNLIYQTRNDLGRSTMKYRDGDIQNWNNLDEAEIVIFHSWNDSRLFIDKIDEAQRLVHFTGPIGRRLKAGVTSSGYSADSRTYANRYYVENILEALDYPGEWYLDTKSGKLYLYPTDDLVNSELRTPCVSQLLILQGNVEAREYVQHVNFEGLTFSDAAYSLPKEGIPTIKDVGDIYKPSAITFDGAKFCTFKNNCVRNVGTYAVEVTGDGNSITHNKIYDTGGGGVITASFGREANEITFNEIYDCGKIWFSACGVNVDDGGGYIANNLIHNISHTGVYGRHWASKTQEQERRNQEQRLTIEFNEIRDIGGVLNDNAGIFIRDSNIVINNNLIYNVSSFMYYEMMGQYNDKGVPGWGIYLGCESRGVTVSNNIVYNMNEGMHLLFGARHNTIENNIFADCLKRMIRYETKPAMPLTHNKFIRNIIYMNNPYAEIFNVGHDKDLPEESDDNVFYYPGGKTPLVGDSARVDPGSYATWLGLGYEKHSKVADPLFKDPANHNYDLLPTSPALQLGFKPIDISNVGLKTIE